MDDTRKILVAFNSPTMQMMASDALKQKGYTVYEATDGMDAFNKILDLEIDCIVAYAELPEISGYGLSRLIKNTPELRSIAVIIASTEDNSVYRFWSENSNSDGFYIMRPSNAEYLCSIVEHAIQKYSFFARPAFSDIRKKNFHSIISQAYEEELFKLYTAKNAYTAIGSIFDMSELLSKIADGLSRVCDFDAAAIIVNNEPLVQRFYRNGPISNEDYADFMQICHSDFKSRITNKKTYNWEQSDFKEETIEMDSEEYEKIKSYEVYPLDSEKKYSLTFHVASCREDAFSKHVSEKLDFFTSIYALLIENAVMYHKTLQSEYKMRTSFSRFLPAKVINNIVEGKTSISDSIGENRKVAVLIADIRDFTSISEVNSPEKVVEFLNYFFGVMGVIIRNHGGTIDKFMGDCIMALFGAPESYVDNGIRAANAALEMIQAKIDTSSIVLPPDYQFKFGIGIHYGDMIVGTIGSNERKDYTVIGDNVNIASRIEGLTKVFGSPIIVTERIKEDIDMYFNNTIESADRNNIPHSSRYLGVVKVKGKKKPVKIFEINSDMNKYPEVFTEKYYKGLDRFIDGDIDGALDYFNAAHDVMPEDKACTFCIEECTRILKTGIPENWDGSFKFLQK